MKNVKITMCLVVVFVMAISNFASAETIRGIDMDFVSIGNAGNVADPPGYGAVNSNYRIGKYEVTANQWQIINTAAGIGDSGTWSNNQPVASISWYDAARFCNYLTSGNKNFGAYLLGTNGSITVDRTAAISTYGTVYVIPTEDEWYKAAYFKPDDSGYSMYANGTNTALIAGLDSNYDNAIGTPWNVGNGTQEQNGTFDMMGNVWEWNETICVNWSGSGRGLRGSAFNDYGGNIPSGYGSYMGSPSIEYGDLGFRVASIPEPCSLVLMSLGGLLLSRRKK
jgi:formylglycine-generating enzyme required for sulfatase activity